VFRSPEDTDGTEVALVLNKKGGKRIISIDMDYSVLSLNP